MTLQARHAAEKQTFQGLLQKAQQIRDEGLKIDQELIRSDARMKQLEDLMAANVPADDLPPVPAMTLVEPKTRGRKPKTESAA